MSVLTTDRVSVRGPAHFIQNDTRTQVVWFTVNRYRDGIDLAGLSWSIHILNAAGIPDVAVPFEQPDVRGDKIIIGWLVHGTATAAAGDLTFNLRGVGEDENGNALRWSGGDEKRPVYTAQESEPSDEQEAALSELDALIEYVGNQLPGVISAGKEARAAANAANASAEAASNAGTAAASAANAAIEATANAKNLPYIGENGNWYLWDTKTGAYVDSGKPSRGDGSDGGGGITEETDPTVPNWAKAPNKPSYTAAEVGALPATYVPPNQTAAQVGADPAGTASKAVSTHNTSGTAHNDIRLELSALAARINAALNSDDVNLDQMAEIVAYIKSNKSLIDSITTGKVSVSDIVNNLTTNAANKPLSAAQGVALKALIDAITVPTKLSELGDDASHRLVTDDEKSAWSVKLDSTDLPEAINTALAQAKESGEFDGKNGSDASVTEDSIKSALGYMPASKDTVDKISGEIGTAISVKRHGAFGDGVTDDTAAFVEALAENREVYVPGGTYVLSGELTIGRNCGLILAQDVVLSFTQSSGNCISMRASANIRGNHALVKVPYEFTGRVINIYAGLDESIVAVPPFTAWGPMWTVARYITDLHIAKLDYRGVAQSVDGTCSGTAVYLGASREDALPFLWAVDLARLRISGAFTYGIHMDTLKVGMDAWIHQSRISGFVDGAEIGVYAKDSTLSYLDVMVIPRRAFTMDGEYVAYAKHGIYLDGCTEVDMSGSRVMDWNSTYTLWKEGNMYQHIALMGDCHGAIVNSHYYYSMPGYDIRSLIYTNNPENLDTVTIIQEPITRWFKPLGQEPFFFNGDHEKRLLLKEELDEFVVTERKPNFDDKLSKAVDKNGAVFNEIGYIRSGNYWNGETGNLANSVNYGCTGFIAVSRGSVIRTSALYVNETDTQCGVVLYDSNFNRLMHVDATKMQSNSASYYLSGYKRTDEGMEFTVNQPAALAYITISFRRADVGELPVVAVNEPISFSPHGYVADTILVKRKNVEGLNENYYTKTDINAIMGSYINDVAAIIGGDA